MTDMVTIVVNCWRGGKIVRSYDFPTPISPAAHLTRPPSDQELIDQAKANLSNERIAFPPWADIEFMVVRPRGG